MGLFSRKPKQVDPQEWTQLWELLSSLDPRMSMDGVAAWAGKMGERPLKAVLPAVEQLARAYALFDTEQVAEMVYPWNGPGTAFPHTDFMRSIDAVILAGPKAASQVLEDASAMRAYTAPAATGESWYFTPADDARPLLIALELVLDQVWPRKKRPSGPRGGYHLASFGPGHAAAWPSLAAHDDASSVMAEADPSRPWLELDGGMPERSQDDWGTFISWQVAGYRAADRIIARAGDAITPSSPHILLEGMTPEDMEGMDGSQAEQLPDGSLYDVMVLTDDESQETDPDARADILTRRAARALLGFELPEPARAHLEPLAAGAL